MPFMRGKAPIRRTLNYLKKGKLAIKDPIKIFTLNYNYTGEQNAGAKDFAFWYLPQIQFKNPGVQILAVRNLTPTPFIRCFFGKKIQSFHSVFPLEMFGRKLSAVFFVLRLENGKDLVMDIDGKTKEEILEHLINVIGKSV